jgi:hypothetical protein
MWSISSFLSRSWGNDFNRLLHWRIIVTCLASWGITFGLTGIWWARTWAWTTRNTWISFIFWFVMIFIRVVISLIVIFGSWTISFRLWMIISVSRLTKITFCNVIYSKIVFYGGNDYDEFSLIISICKTYFCYWGVLLFFV